MVESSPGRGGLGLGLGPVGRARLRPGALPFPRCASSFFLLAAASSSCLLLPVPPPPYATDSCSYSSCSSSCCSSSCCSSSCSASCSCSCSSCSCPLSPSPLPPGDVHPPGRLLALRRRVPPKPGLDLDHEAGRQSAGARGPRRQAVSRAPQLRSRALPLCFRALKHRLCLRSSSQTVPINHSPKHHPSW